MDLTALEALVAYFRLILTPLIASQLLLIAITHQNKKVRNLHVLIATFFLSLFTVQFFELINRADLGVDVRFFVTAPLEVIIVIYSTQVLWELNKRVKRND